MLCYVVIGWYILIAGSEMKSFSEHLVALGRWKNKINYGEIFVKFKGEIENKGVLEG